MSLCIVFLLFGQSEVCAAPFLPDVAHWTPRVLLTSDRLVTQGHDQEALSLLSAAHHDHPEQIDVTLALADLEVRLGQRSEAMQLLGVALQRFPQYPALYNNYAVLYHDHHLPADVCAILSQGLSIAPDDALLRNNSHLLHCPEDSAVQSVGDTHFAYHDSILKEEDRRSIQGLISRWLLAWSQQNHQAFFNAYASDYVPPLDWNVGQWESRRIALMKALGHFSVHQASPLMYLPSVSRKKVVVCFLQIFQMPYKRRMSYKVLVLSLYHHAWKIKNEFLSRMPCEQIVKFSQ